MGSISFANAEFEILSEMRRAEKLGKLFVEMGFVFGMGMRMSLTAIFFEETHIVALSFGWNLAGGCFLGGGQCHLRGL